MKEISEIPSTAPERRETNWVMVFNLIMGKGPGETKRTYKINKKRIVIGSALSSDIRIQQNAVSNVHAVVEMDEQGQAHIYDMASETGVFINDQKTLHGELKDGDELKIGFATLTYKRAGIPESGTKVPEGPGRKLFYDTQEDFRPLILEDERNVIQIFDYPAAGEQALQVVMYWGDVILDVRHIVEQEPVTIGESAKATFLVPGVHTDIPLVSFDGGVTLEFNEEMTGVVRSGQEVTPLQDLGARRFLLKQSDLAKIQFREITFFLNYTPMPPHLKRQRVLERDPFYTKVWFSSLLLTLAFILLLVGIEPPEKLDTEEVAPRTATIIFKPIPPPAQKIVKPKEDSKPPVKREEPKKRPPPPKKIAKRPAPTKTLPKKVKVAKKTQKAAPAKAKAKPTSRVAGGNAGEGARAKGTEGKKGAPNKPKARVHQVQSRGSPSARTAAKSQSNRGQGTVETLFDNISGTISQKIAASGKGASAAGKRLRGYGGFTTEGNGGLGNLGAGTGGGGSSQSVQGLGTKGLGEGASGKGLGAIGSGGNLLGTGRGRPSVEVGGSQETIVLGGLDPSIIDRIVREHIPQISNCFRKGLGSNPNLRGRIVTRWVITASGRVSQQGVSKSEMGNPAVEKCLLGVIHSMTFPEPVGGGVVEVSYPFDFQPAVKGQ